MPNIEPLRKQVQAKIRKFELLANSGLWVLALFTGLSIGAYREFEMLPTLGENVRALLGAGPPVNMINWALVLYGFCALIIALAQMTGNKRPRGVLANFCYLSAFYAFYHLTGAMRDNFWAVFTVGMTILSLQGYHVWNYYRDQVREQQEILIELNKLAE
jgi:hypothetical protein